MHVYQREAWLSVRPTACYQKQHDDNTFVHWCSHTPSILRLLRRLRGLGHSTLHVRVGGWGHLTLLAAVGRGLALGALQQRRRQRLAARGVAALEGHGVGRPVRFITLLNYCSDSSRQLINGHQGMPEPRHVCVRGARPRPRRAARLRPRLPRVQRILPPHALPLLRPVHQRPLPPGSAPQPRRGRKKSQHNRQRSQCQDCGGASICQHNRIRSRCNDFGGASICQHNRQRGQCKDCGGTSICEHNRQR